MAQSKLASSPWYQTYQKYQFFAGPCLETISKPVLYVTWSDRETYSGPLFDVVGVGVEPNVEFPNKDVLVEPVGFEEREPKVKPGSDPTPKVGAAEVTDGAVAAEVIAENKLELANGPGPEVVVRLPPVPVPVNPVAVSDVEVDEVQDLE
jgi:hypothetical protein